MSEPEDWDDKIEALDALHERLKSRVIESQPILPGPVPPVPDTPDSGEPAIKPGDSPSPLASDLPEVSPQPVCVESRPLQAPVAPKIHEAGNALASKPEDADSQDERTAVRPVVVLLACAVCLLVLIALFTLRPTGQGALVALPPPRGQMRRVESLAAEQLASSAGADSRTESMLLGPRGRGRRISAHVHGKRRS